MGLRRRRLRYKTAAGSGHCCLDSNEVKCYMCWPQKAGGARLRRGVRTQYYGNTCGGILCQTLSLSAMCIYRVSQKKVGSQKTSNCSNSLNFEAKLKCNTIKPNVAKWRIDMHRLKI